MVLLKLCYVFESIFFKIFTRDLITFGINILFILCCEYLLKYYDSINLPIV